MPLFGETPKSPRPAKDRDFLLEQAFARAIDLYIAVPKGKVAFAGLDAEMVMTEDSLRYRPIITTHSLHTIAFSLGQGIPYPELAFLKLNRDRTDVLNRPLYLSDSLFLTGLAPHPSRKLRRSGWMVPWQFSRPLGLCLTEETSMGFVQWSNSPEQRIQFSESEVYLDQHALTLLDNLGISSRGDLHDLRDRSVGVYHLYRAAKKFCIKKRAKSFDSALVEEWINAEFGELYGKTIARHAAKLINPKYKKGAGKKGAKKHFSRGALARLNLDKDYAPERLEPFVSEPLAFLLAAADWWTRELKKLSNRERDTLSRGHLMNTLIGLGFEGEEEIDSLMSIVMWPEKSSPKKT